MSNIKQKLFLDDYIFFTKFGARFCHDCDILNTIAFIISEKKGLNYYLCRVHLMHSTHYPNNFSDAHPTI